MSAPFIPAATAQKLTSDIPKGERHKAKMDIAISLVGNGISPNAVAQTLRDKFPEASDSEINSVVQWAVNKNPTPSGYGTPANGVAAPKHFQPAKVSKPQPNRTAAQRCDWWMGDAKMTVEQMTEQSPIAFKGSPVEELVLFFEQLYRPDDKLNIVCKFTLSKEGKANPSGAGKTQTRDEWIEYFHKSGVPQSEAGAWLRMNPCKDGSGANGAITDADVTAWCYVLVESDAVPIETQLALFHRLKLPVAAIMSSGGKSVHAWVRVNCPDADSYAARTKRILEILAPFGIDQANKNASRLSRLPSAVRVIKAQDGGKQSLVYLNPAVLPMTDADVDSLAARVSVQITDGQPMRGLMRDSVERYAELYANRGKLGVQVGLDEFDSDTGGFKPGQMTVIAAETNKGKSTVAINLVNGAILRGHGVALFTLEMDREEIADLLIANNCMVNRNCFNTGYFIESDIPKITARMPELTKLPLWIFDDASMTVEDIRKHVEALNAEGRLSMVVIDYVQIVTPNDPRSPREQQVAEIARAIRIMAKQTKLPFIVLSQLNDDGKLRESRVVGHEAHNVIQLDPNDEQTIMTLKVIRGRRILKKDYHCDYQPEYARITAARISPQDIPTYNRE